MTISSILYKAVGFLIPLIFYHFYYRKINKKIDKLQERANNSFTITELKDIQKEVENFGYSIKLNFKTRRKVTKLKSSIIHKIEKLESLR